MACVKNIIHPIICVAKITVSSSLMFTCSVQYIIYLFIHIHLCICLQYILCLCVGVKYVKVQVIIK